MNPADVDKLLKQTLLQLWLAAFIWGFAGGSAFVLAVLWIREALQ